MTNIKTKLAIFFSVRNNRFNKPHVTIGTIRYTEAMFTLYRIVKRSVAESVPDRASVHTRTAAFEAVSAPEQYCSAPLLKVECSISDRFFETVRIKSEHFYQSRNCNGTSFW